MSVLCVCVNVYFYLCIPFKLSEITNNYRHLFSAINGFGKPQKRIFSFSLFFCFSRLSLHLKKNYLQKTHNVNFFLTAVTL